MEVVEGLGDAIYGRAEANEFPGRNETDVLTRGSGGSGAGRVGKVVGCQRTEIGRIPQPGRQDEDDACLMECQLLSIVPHKFSTYTSTVVRGIL